MELIDSPRAHRLSAKKNFFHTAEAVKPCSHGAKCWRSLPAPPRSRHNGPGAEKTGFRAAIAENMTGLRHSRTFIPHEANGSQASKTCG